MMNELRHAKLSSATTPAIGWMAWCVGALLAAALIGLLHDRGYANAMGLKSAEAGRGLELKAVNEVGVSAASPVRLIGLGLLLSVGAACVLTLPRGVPVQSGALLPLIGLALFWAAASWLWSVDRGTTARELARLSICAGVAAALARRFELRELCVVVVIALSASALSAVGYEVVSGGFKPWQADYRMTGTLHSNALGIQAGVVAILAYAFAKRGNDYKFVWYTVLVAAVTVVILTKTRTALATVFVGIVVAHTIGRPARQWLFYGSLAATAVAIGLVSASVFDYPFDKKIEKIANLGRSGDDAESLTGRVPLWGFILEETASRRLQGVGYGAFWMRDRTYEANVALQWFPRQSHSAYVDILANLGVVGLVLVVALALAALIQSVVQVNLSGLPEYCALASILTAAFVNGITETAFTAPRDIGQLVGAMILSLVLRPVAGSATHASLANSFGVVSSSRLNGHSRKLRITSADSRLNYRPNL